MANTFALILVIMTAVTGVVWLIDKFKWAPIRNKAREAAQNKAEMKLDQEMLIKIEPENVLIENARSLFPVIFFVFFLRSFLYEPFQIPSGSMMPTLLIGDFILVEKYSYGVKEPVWQNKLFSVGTPKRGDVAVFKYPEDPRVDYIKRVVGLPGDRIVYKEKRLYLIPACKGDCGNYKQVELHFDKDEYFVDEQARMQIYQEELGDVRHKILINPMRSDQSAYYYQQTNVATYEYEWVVPEGHYFMMGDNRDNSKDSRYWGFVPEQNLVGKAVAKWISFEFYRDPEGFIPTWIPSKIRFDRIGAIK
jgi:signal peptidase I